MTKSHTVEIEKVTEKSKAFVTHIRQLYVAKDFDLVINADQSGFERLIIAKRALTSQGVKKFEVILGFLGIFSTFSNRYKCQVWVR